jgi:hypothetical protein
MIAAQENQSVNKSGTEVEEMMTEKRMPKEQSTPLDGFETGRFESKGSRKKAHRVSQRRELIVVTLGAVAAITGLGGVLASNPPGWATSLDTTAQETSVSDTPAAAESLPDDEASAPVQETPSAQPASSQAPVQEAAPSFSTTSQAPAATKSRGS